MEGKIYDYAVIGGGLTGIITALILKKECPDKSVILFEKNKFLGGLAGTEVIENYYFDSVYLFPYIGNYLKYLDLKYDFYKYENAIFRYYEIKDNNDIYKIDIAYKKDMLEENLITEFPDEKNNIKKFINDAFLIEKKFSTSLKTKLNITDILKLLFTSYKLIINMNKSLEEFLKKYKFKNQQLINVIGALSGLAGLPPDKLNSIITLAAFGSLNKGAYRQKNCFNDFMNVLLEKLKAGKIDQSLNNEVLYVDKYNNIFKLKTKNGNEIFCKKVISSINTKKFFKKIFNNKLLSNSFKTKIENIKMTHSAFIIRLIIKDKKDIYPTNIGQLLFYKGKNAFKHLYELANNNQSILSEDYYHFACAVRELKKGIYSVELLAIPVSYLYWEKLYDKSMNEYKKEIMKWEKFYFKKLECCLIQDLNKKIIIKKIITPIDLNKLNNSYHASIYDMAYINSQSGSKRLMFKTPVKNLYHCKMVHGVYGAFFQSFLLADYILKGKINNYNFKFNY